MGTTSVQSDPPRSPVFKRAALYERLSRAGKPALLAWTIVPLAITLLAWQTVPLEPAPGLDPSWTAGLEMAVHDGITFGTHAIFSYGPLGFLTYQFLWYGHLGAASFLYALLIRFAAALAVFLGARRTFGGPAAFVIAVIVASIDDQLLEMVAFLIAVVWAMTAAISRRAALEVSIAAGAFSGFELLGKVSIGIALAAMTVVLVLSLPRRRRDYALAAAGALVVTLLVFWVLTGQALGALPNYIENSEQVVSGYAAAMSLGLPGLGWESAAALFGLAIGLWGAFHMTADGEPRERWGVALIWVTFWFFAFKEGFVRHDSGHAAYFFESLLGGFFAFRWRADHRLPALAAAAALLSITLAAQALPFSAAVDPTSNLRSAVDQIRDVVSTSRRQAIIAAGRVLIEASEPIDPTSLSLLSGHTVDIYPVEIALAWAYRLDWDPLPVLQSYTAYTTALDQVDADFLASRQAPQRILWQNVGDIDGRVLSFDQGQTSRTILCRYQELHVAPPFAVLGLGPDRCSSPVPLGTVHAGWGQTVPIPAPPTSHSFVFVRIGGSGVSGLESLRALLDKPAQRTVVLGRAIYARLVTGTASDGLPLRASPGMDYAPPFNIAPNITTIAVLKGGQAPTTGGPLTFSFYAQSFDAAPVAPAYALAPAGDAIIARAASASARCSTGQARRPSRLLISSIRALIAMSRRDPLQITAGPQFTGQTAAQVVAAVQARCKGLPQSPRSRGMGRSAVARR